jgi:predicted RNA-binding protein with PIN domain
MHPELPVAVTDSAATARCYFDRVSAPDVESLDEAEARAQILADAAALKKLAKDYMHPELPVAVTDSAATARCYFDRISAPEVESLDEAEARAQIFADVTTLKKLTKDYMHPELPVAVTDIYATARCYFDRISAPEVESHDEAEARAQILADAALLKKLAKDYMHPELPVSVTDSAATARCYFDRISAPEVESLDEAEARAQVLADAAALKKLAKDYMHPELPVVVTDIYATARCYFDRPSADLFSPPRRITTVTKIDNEVVRARSDTEQFDFDDDVFHDLKENLTRFSRAHSFGLEEESKVMDKEEEGNLSRSPSCIMLFDMVGERSY